MEWNDTMQKSIPFHDFGMEWWDDLNLIIPFQYFPNVIHSSNYYKIDYHSFVKQESTEFTALTNKKSVWIWWTQACCLFPKNMICCLWWEKGWVYCLASLNTEADFYRGNETRHYQSWPRILGTEIPRSEIWRCVNW